MKRWSRYFLIAVLMLFLISCNLLNVFTKSSDSDSDPNSSSTSGNEVSSGSGGTSSSAPFAESPKAKKFDGELNILDQYYWVPEDGTINYALLIENTSSKLTVTDFSQGATITDSSGAVLPQLNNSGGDSDSWEYSYFIFPNSKYLICSGYQVEKGSTIANVKFNLGSEITASDLGVTESPIKTESVKYIEKPSIGNKDAIGDLRAHFVNQTDKVILYPWFDAAAYDANGKLVGCGEVFDTYSFIPANAKLQIQVPMQGTAKPENIELFTHLSSNGVQKYKGSEPIEVSDVGFTQLNTYVIPRYTLTNTANGMVVDYLWNYLVFGPDDELLSVFSTRGSNFPAGMVFGPNRSSVSQVSPGVTVSRIEYQVHTMDVRNEGKEITKDSVTFGPGTYDTGKFAITAKVTNSTSKQLNVTLAVGCYDDAGNLVGTGGGSALLEPNSETQVEMDEYNTGPSEEPHCSAATKFEVNPISIWEN